MYLQKVLFVLFLTSYHVLQFSNSSAQQKNSGIGFDLGIGYSSFTPFESNNSFGIQNDDFKNTATFSGGIHFYLSNRLAIFSRVSYLNSRVKNKLHITTETSPDVIAVVEDEYKVSSLPVAFGVSYNFPVGKFSLITELAAEYHFAKQSCNFPSAGPNFPGIKREEKQKGFGIAIAAGPEWQLATLLSLGGKIGYRFAEISEFEGNDNGFLLQDVTFDFSGVFFEVGIQIHP